MLRLWVFEFFPELTAQVASKTGRSVADYFQEYLSLWERDEALGFDGIFFSEHHFGGSFSASPNLLLAATAARTRTLRLGVMGVVLPYYPAIRVVEEIGMLDQLSGGRLEIGTAVGVPQELSKVGLDMNEAREIYNESIAIVDQALETGVVNFKGKHFEYENLRLLPRPAQSRPPKWSTVINADSARRAARRNSKICTGFVSCEEMRSVFDAYDAEMNSLGHTASGGNLGIRRRIVVAPSRSQAKELSEAVFTRYKNFSGTDSRMKFSQVPDGPAKSGAGFTVSGDEFIAGTPSDVAEAILDQCRKTGAQHFMAILHWGADIDEVRSAHELFGREVIPVLKKAHLSG